MEEASLDGAFFLFLIYSCFKMIGDRLHKLCQEFGNILLIRDVGIFVAIKSEVKTKQQ